MTFMMFFVSPFKQLVAVNDQFSKLETQNNASTIFFFKIIYMACVLATMAIGVYKLGTMGLLPNTRSDWVAFEVPARHTSAGLTLNENWDSDVRADMSDALGRIAPEGDMYRHDCEGSDDMPAHIRSSCK
ncbi:hypothetical protein DV451_003290 [Geotrichum candidum]|uniref:ER membrane protein complex subunit 4 n=1 Tax=Geotrichum candidum TaxID=1173061 RepID=A0A9P5G499_GEOCN|nr:hypothetical protein DV451_003290 [Geotrichum candidum]KAI9210027.1 hypothetical protein DS838_005088 [Geotrichum bryndzae]KAF5105968.1 hypothetical protein DV453_004353 [Geotrichum candidum]KAF5107536.1 hypothetical protein DV452_004936 [Geotrichum candidum]KAF5111267.1 hypothetical protein DV454_004719 [Geotrichum candidum]